MMLRLPRHQSALPIVASLSLLACNADPTDHGLEPLTSASLHGAANDASQSLAAFPGEIAFVREVSAPSEFAIHAICPDGSGLRRLTDGQAPDFRPVWSPDGRSLLFASVRSGNPDVWRMDANGGSLQNLTPNSPTLDFRAAWFPNGRRVVFSRGRPEELQFNSLGRPIAGNLEIFVMNAAGGSPRNLSNHAAFDARPLVSPNGGSIAFDSNRDGDREIYVMKADGTGLRQLTDNGFGDDHPVWSPNGRQILFTSNRDGNLEIYVMNADGSGQRNLTKHENDDTHAAWSPDGKHIVFETNRDGNREIYLMRSDGTDQRNLTNDAESEDGEPHWGRHACAGGGR